MKATDVKEGFTHGRWMILSDDFTRMKSGAAIFLARCACGTEKSLMFRGHFMSESCGCLQRETAKKTFTVHGGSRVNGKKTRLYRIWQGMKRRCTDESYEFWENYGGRGISVCPDWASNFGAFQTWALSNGYKEDLQLDRIDNDGDYCPYNCQWVTAKENLNNTRWNRLVYAFGEIKTMAQWADDPRCTITYKNLESRLRRNWDAEDAISLPSGHWNPKRKKH